MSLFSRHIDKQIATYQRELIETHYAEVENMYIRILKIISYSVVKFVLV